jgi:hypothetical protein
VQTNIDSVRSRLAYRPFRPFWLETVGGTRIRVVKPEWFHEVPDSFGRLLISDLDGVTITNWRI